MSLLRYHVEVLSFQQLNLCEVPKHFLRQTRLRITDEIPCVCSRKDNPLLFGKLSTTDSRLLARQPRVVADHLNVFLLPTASDPETFGISGTSRHETKHLQFRHNLMKQL